jgi:hypothetical protein
MAGSLGSGCLSDEGPAGGRWIRRMMLRPNESSTATKAAGSKWPHRQSTSQSALPASVTGQSSHAAVLKPVADGTGSTAADRGAATSEG